MNDTTTLLTRRADLAPASADRDARTVEVIWSTGAPVRRRDMAGQYIERLSLDPQAVDRRQHLRHRCLFLGRGRPRRALHHRRVPAAEGQRRRADSRRARRLGQQREGSHHPGCGALLYRRRGGGRGERRHQRRGAAGWGSNGGGVRIAQSSSLVMPSVRSICFRRFLRPLFSLGVFGSVIVSRPSKPLFASSRMCLLSDFSE